MSINLTDLIRKYFRIILQIAFFSCLIFKFEYGVAIWILISLLSMFLGRLYCGFFCTWGTYQEWIGMLGKKIFKHKFDTFIPKKVDNVLSCFRYVVMIAYAFFAESFFTSKIVANLGGPNTDALVNIIFSRKIVTVSVIISLFIFTILSLLINRPYCKYLCHGSVEAGALSFAKIFKLRRNPNICVNCHKCENVCPMNVPITKMETVYDRYCISCFQCIGDRGCPKKDALYLDMHPIKTFLKEKNKKYSKEDKINHVVQKDI
ncbi:4Fe-4S binding protein [Clostridium tyrobutyricum]|uniref:4Fe-4S binding protein n=1 Tax=Clostridium tyrobutyricum TaxID=1519 RepID=UPI0030CF7E00